MCACVIPGARRQVTYPTVSLLFYRCQKQPPINHSMISDEWGSIDSDLLHVKQKGDYQCAFDKLRAVQLEEWTQVWGSTPQGLFTIQSFILCFIHRKRKKKRIPFLCILTELKIKSMFVRKSPCDVVRQNTEGVFSVILMDYHTIYNMKPTKHKVLVCLIQHCSEHAKDQVTSTLNWMKFQLEF